MDVLLVEISQEAISPVFNTLDVRFFMLAECGELLSMFRILSCCVDLARQFYFRFSVIYRPLVLPQTL